MNVRVLKSMSWAFALAFAVLVPVAMAAAQDETTPAVKGEEYDSNSQYRWDIFMGYR